LNDAYQGHISAAETLSSGGGHDVREVVDRKKGLFGRVRGAPKRAAVSIDHYHLLALDVTADAHVIDLAYAFWVQHHRADSGARARIDEAHRVLSDPDLRAKYDGTGHKASSEKSKAAIDVPVQIQNAQHNRIRTPETAPVRAVESPPLPAVIPAEVPMVRAERTPLVLATAPSEPEQPAEDLPRHHPSQSVIARLLPRRAEPAPATVAAEPPAAAAAAVTTEHSSAPAPAEPHRKARWFGAHRQDAHEVAEAQQHRLLELRETRASDAAPCAERAPLAPSFAASLTMSSGPLAGEQIELRSDTIRLGAGPTCEVVLTDASGTVEPEHAQLTRRGGTYVFRDLACHDTLVGGVNLVLPLVILEDGDEIQIGPHGMRFSTGSPVDRAPAALSDVLR
jgi:hypothetical protein